MRRVAVLSIALGGCSLIDGPTMHPHRDVTLLVSNARCSVDGCDSVRVFLVPSNRPTTPGGGWKIQLGVFNTAQACLRLPNSAEFKVTEVGSNGATVKETRYEWTPSIGASLGAVLAGESTIPASASTPEFFPGDDAGWTLSLPGPGPATTHAACTP